MTMQQRRTILQMLYEARSQTSSGTLDGEELARQMGVPWNEVRHEVDYLVEKGYIKLNCKQVGTRIFSKLNIAADGIDLVEGWVIDEAAQVDIETLPGTGVWRREALSQLRQILASYFGEGDLRILCFELDVDYDDLPVVGKTNKAAELINYLRRRSRLSELVEIGERLRPDIPWQKVSVGEGSEGDIG